MRVLPTLQKQHHPLASGAAQRRRLAELPLARTFEAALEGAGLLPLVAAGIDVLQINVGKKCNQTCRHCHVDAGPDRTEMMPPDVVDACLRVLAESAIPTLDITGGDERQEPCAFERGLEGPRERPLRPRRRRCAAPRGHGWCCFCKVGRTPAPHPQPLEVVPHLHSMD